MSVLLAIAVLDNIEPDIAAVANSFFVLTSTTSDGVSVILESQLLLYPIDAENKLPAVFFDVKGRPSIRKVPMELPLLFKVIRPWTVTWLPTLFQYPSCVENVTPVLPPPKLTVGTQVPSE